MCIIKILGEEEREKDRKRLMVVVVGVFVPRRERYILYIYVSQNERIDRRLPPSQ